MNGIKSTNIVELPVKLNISLDRRRVYIDITGIGEPHFQSLGLCDGDCLGMVIDTGKGGGIGWGLSETIENAEVPEENIIDPKTYHTVYEVKNGQGPHPILTEKGWLHLAHGVRNTAAGLRYVLYVFMSDKNDITK